MAATNNDDIIRNTSELVNPRAESVKVDDQPCAIRNRGESTTTPKPYLRAAYELYGSRARRMTPEQRYSRDSSTHDAEANGVRNERNRLDDGVHSERPIEKFRPKTAVTSGSDLLKSDGHLRPPGPAYEKSIQALEYGTKKLLPTYHLSEG